MKLTVIEQSDETLSDETLSDEKLSDEIRFDEYKSYDQTLLDELRSFALLMTAKETPEKNCQMKNGVIKLDLINITTMTLFYSSLITHSD